MEVAVHGPGPLRDNDVRHLQGIIIQNCRAILSGASIWDSEAQRERALRHHDVPRRFKFAPSISRTTHTRAEVFTRDGCTQEGQCAISRHGFRKYQ
eukprot:8435797-Pyramimonas_sp.AAC.1